MSQPTNCSITTHHKCLFRGEPLSNTSRSQSGLVCITAAPSSASCITPSQQDQQQKLSKHLLHFPLQPWKTILKLLCQAIQTIIHTFSMIFCHYWSTILHPLLTIPPNSLPILYVFSLHWLLGQLSIEVAMSILLFAKLWFFLELRLLKERKKCITFLRGDGGGVSMGEGPSTFNMLINRHMVSLR